MKARELHDLYADDGSRLIVSDDERMVILRALALAAAVEGSQDGLVRELGGFVDHLHERGHDEDAQLVEDARARLVAQSERIAKMKAGVDQLRVSAMNADWHTFDQVCKEMKEEA